MPCDGTGLDPVTSCISWRPASCLHVADFKSICSWKYRRTLVTDGNFSLQNMNMKHPEQDVQLIDGEGYGAEEVPYRKHLAVALEYFQV